MSETIRGSLPRPSSSGSDGTPAPDADPEALPLPDDVLDALPDAHRGAIKRLQGFVQRAAAEIESLQDENERLRRRVARLEQRPAVPENGSVLTVDTPPGDLRERITASINAIDRYLDATAS